MTEIGTQCGLLDDSAKSIVHERSRTPLPNGLILPRTSDALMRTSAVPLIVRRRHSLDDGRGKASRLAALETIDEVDFSKPQQTQIQQQQRIGTTASIRRGSTGLPDVKSSLGNYQPKAAAATAAAAVAAIDLSALSLSKSEVFGTGTGSEIGYLKPTKASMVSHADLHDVQYGIESSLHVRDRRRISYPKVSSAERGLVSSAGGQRKRNTTTAKKQRQQTAALSSDSEEENSNLGCWESAAEQPYCAICNRAFKTLGHLQTHIDFSTLHAHILESISTNKKATTAAGTGTGDKPQKGPLAKEAVEEVMREDAKVRLLYSGTKYFSGSTADTKAALELEMHVHEDFNVIEIITFDGDRLHEMDRLYLDYLEARDCIPEAEIHLQATKIATAAHRNTCNSMDEDTASRLCLASFLLSRLRLRLDKTHLFRYVTFNPSAGANTAAVAVSSHTGDDEKILLPGHPTGMRPVVVSRFEVIDPAEVRQGLTELHVRQKSNRKLIKKLEHLEKVTELALNELSNGPSLDTLVDLATELGRKTHTVQSPRRLLTSRFVDTTTTAAAATTVGGGYYGEQQSLLQSPIAAAGGGAGRVRSSTAKGSGGGHHRSSPSPSPEGSRGAVRSRPRSALFSEIVAVGNMGNMGNIAGNLGMTAAGEVLLTAGTGVNPHLTPSAASATASSAAAVTRMLELSDNDTTQHQLLAPLPSDAATSGFVHTLLPATATAAAATAPSAPATNRSLFADTARSESSAAAGGGRDNTNTQHLTGTTTGTLGTARSNASTVASGDTSTSRRPRRSSNSSSNAKGGGGGAAAGTLFREISSLSVASKASVEEHVRLTTTTTTFLPIIGDEERTSEEVNTESSSPCVY